MTLLAVVGLLIVLLNPLVLHQRADHLHIGVVHRLEMLRSLKGWLVDGHLWRADVPDVRREQRVLVVATVMLICIGHSSRSVRPNRLVIHQRVLRMLALHAALELLLLLQGVLLELLELLLDLLLLLPVRIDHIHVGVELRFDLLHFALDHLLHLRVAVSKRDGRSVVKRVHDFVDEFCLELLPEVRVHCAEVRQAFDSLVDVLARFQLSLQLLELCIRLVSGVLNLSKRGKLPVPDSLLELEFARVVEELLERAVHLDCSLDVLVVEHPLHEGLVADEDHL